MSDNNGDERVMEKDAAMTELDAKMVLMAIVEMTLLTTTTTTTKTTTSASTTINDNSFQNLEN